MSNKNLDGKYGIRYGIFAPPLAEQLKEQGYRFPDKKTEDKFENANKAISTIHMAVLITDAEWEKILDRFHNALIREAVEMKKEKKWRAFKTIEEFFDIYKKNVGSHITYRVKANPLREITTSIMGYIKEPVREDQLQIGVATLLLSAWYEVAEIWDEDKESWLPFGVLKDENEV